MKILIVAATQFEIQPTLLNFGCNELKEGSVFKTSNAAHEIIFLVTGVGMVNTTYYLTKELEQMNPKPDLCVNVGIAGSFDREIKIGDIVQIRNDRFAELGAEDGDNFLTLDEMNLGTQGISFQCVPRAGFDSRLKEINGIGFGKFKVVSGITVNKVHGEDNSIRKTVEKFDPHIETMESAAFILVCARETVTHIQFRSISNFIEKRNKENWNIPLAIKNLNEFLLKLLSTHNSQLPTHNS